MKGWMPSSKAPAALLAAAVIAGAVIASGLPARAVANGTTGVRSTGAVAASRLRAMRVTSAERFAAADRAAVKRTSPLNRLANGLRTALVGPSVIATFTPLAMPDYFGIIPNWALSPLPDLDASGNPVPGTGIRKFVDSLPGLGSANANDLGQYIPVATPDTVTYPGSDYYVIALVRYKERLHRDLPPTTLQGYVQLNSAGTATMTPPSYLGPTIVARKDRPVRVKFINKLPTGAGGDLFIPVDTTLMGAGLGPDGVHSYSQNRGTLHLHGGNTPWISDGTPHQWTTPATEGSAYPKGVSVQNVPDMPAAGPGTLTFFYTNQQSARLMFYHDHSYGLTRLNVYAGEAAPYIVTDSAETSLQVGGTIAGTVVAPATIPTEQVPLVIQDKTFVPTDTAMVAQDPTWDPVKYGRMGSLWFPHVYMPNQNPADNNGVNALGRWDYAFWMYPPLIGVMHGPVANPLAGVNGEPPQNPGTPNPTAIPEAFMDTPLVNGTAYPYLKVERKAYRFRILNACNDRMLNLQIYYAASNTPASVDGSGNPTLQTASGEVPMVPASRSTIPTWPANWPIDGRDGGVPDPAARGPQMVQIGTEGGFLPAPTAIPNQPVNYEYNRRTILFGNVSTHALLLGPAERADVVVDFSQVPAGSKLILYNDAPAPMPGFDSRNDYYTGDPDQTAIGGAPTTKAGYGPNTRTVMQFDVSGPAAPAFNVAALGTGLKAAYRATQDRPLVPESAYGPTFGTTYTDNYAHVVDTTMTFRPISQASTVSIPLVDKAVIEGFDMDYGRMNAQLGFGLPNFGPAGGAGTNLGYADPLDPSESITDTVPGTLIGTLRDGTQIWLIEHQGVDTHALHFHLFNVQLINRVGIDGTMLPPDPNEIGWKETIRVNPGTNTIVALRAMHQKLPWKLPDSIRPANPLVPLGAKYMNAMGVLVVNQLTDFGWEYVWHCHLLGHEENDMMRPMRFVVAPAPPMSLTAAQTSFTPMRVKLGWTNKWTYPAATSGFIQRATNAAFTTGLTTFSVASTATSFTDTLAGAGTYYYRVRSENAPGVSSWTNVKAVTVSASAPVLTLAASPSSVLLPAPITLSGTLRPSTIGQIVTLYVLRPGATTYIYVSNRGVVNSLGAWSAYRYVPSRRGTYRFYAQSGTVRSPVVSAIVR